MYYHLLTNDVWEQLVGLLGLYNALRYDRGIWFFGPLVAIMETFVHSVELVAIRLETPAGRIVHDALDKQF